MNDELQNEVEEILRWLRDEAKTEKALMRRIMLGHVARVLVRMRDILRKKDVPNPS